MEKDFDDWNLLKKNLATDSNKAGCFPAEGEVWMSILGKNIGFEQNGSNEDFSRPILVVKKFNTHMFWGVPLSTKQKSFDFYYNFSDPQDQKVSVILAQMRLVSVKRFKRKMYELPTNLFLEIQERLASFLHKVEIPPVI